MLTSTNTHRLLSAAASVNATSVYAGRSVLLGIQGANTAAAARFLKLYDTASTPDETLTPRKTIYLPAGATFALDFPAGVTFVSGIAFRLTTAAADNDTGALTAGDVVCLNHDYAK